VTATFGINSYTVTFNGNTNTGGSTTAQSLVYNTATALTANGFTKTGYTFAGWATTAGGAVAYANGANYTIGAAGVTLYAKWTINTYTFTAVPSLGTLTCNGGACSASYNYGTSLSMSATSVAGYTVALSSTGTANGCTSAGGGAGAAATCTAVIPVGNTGVTATYSPISYSITFNSAGGTGVSTITQNYGTAITPPANPTRTGYTFTGWSPALAGTMPVGGQALTAGWSINSYTVSTSAGGGGSISPSSRSVNYNSSTTFTVSPSTGYSIASASGCGGSLSGTTFTTGAITGACTVSATFSINSYTVSTSAGGGGSISPSSQSVNYNSSTTFTVSPSTGYSIASASGCGGYLSGNTYYTGAITGACTVSATFSINSYTLTTAESPSGLGWGSVTGGGTYNYGTVVTVTAIPSVYYFSFPEPGSIVFYFISWSGDCSGQGNPASITMTSNKSCTANFQ
jgi:uncharacterized repeat protein (TIGR02543 family)